MNNTDAKKILVTTSSFAANDDTPLKVFQKAGYEVTLNPFKRRLSEEEVSELINEIKPAGILAGVEPLNENVLTKAAGIVKAIARCGVGMDSVDIDAAKANNISVTNTPDAPVIPVAELTTGMILSLLRMTHVSHFSIKNGGWQRPMGQLLHKKTVGIIGYGRIGRQVAEYLKAFNCNLIAHDPNIIGETSIKLCAIEQLLSESDIVTLHLPYSEKNHNLIDDKKISIMKQGAYLINVARGGLVDENALYDACKSLRLAGAALDCFCDEPYTGKLVKLNNVLLTAHIGSYAKEARIMMELQAAENLLKQLNQE